MSKIKLLLVIGLLSVTGIMAQTSQINQLIIGLNDGIVGSMNESNKIDPFKSHGIRLHLTYKLKTNFGIMVLGGYNSFSTQIGSATKTKYMNATLEGVYTLSSLFHLKNDKFSLLVHAGPGFGTLWNTNFQVAEPTDPYFKNQDEIFNLNLGITPQYAMYENVRLNLDFSFAHNFIQNHTFAYTARTKKTAMMYNLSVGVAFSLSNKKRALQENL